MLNTSSDPTCSIPAKHTPELAAWTIYRVSGFPSPAREIPYSVAHAWSFFQSFPYLFATTCIVPTATTTRTRVPRGRDTRQVMAPAAPSAPMQTLMKTGRRSRTLLRDAASRIGLLSATTVSGRSCKCALPPLLTQSKQERN